MYSLHYKYSISIRQAIAKRLNITKSTGFKTLAGISSHRKQLTHSLTEGFGFNGSFEIRSRLRSIVFCTATSYKMIGGERSLDPGSRGKATQQPCCWFVTWFPVAGHQQLHKRSSDPLCWL
jgi:hypothetical protein